MIFISYKLLLGRFQMISAVQNKRLMDQEAGENEALSFQIYLYQIYKKIVQTPPFLNYLTVDITPQARPSTLLHRYCL